jgi:protoporphyrinogen oxidase
MIVIGAGPTGLAAAYQAVREGHEVDLLEAASEAGGMAGHFDFGGLSLERFTNSFAGVTSQLLIC